MKRWLVVIGVIVAGLLAACSDDHNKAERATPVTTPSPPPVSRWDKSTVFEYDSYKIEPFWKQACGSTTGAIRDTDPCVLEVMKLVNASESSIAFFQRYRFFLLFFEEHGVVDFGGGGAPWLNMGRLSSLLFLNGSPDLIHAPIPDDYMKDASYADAIKAATPLPSDKGFAPLAPFPWDQYGSLSFSTESAAGQRFVIAYPLMECRVCTRVGDLSIAYTFDKFGRLSGTETLPFRPK